ncbi:hypothetical protein OG410_17990 [Streptomyces sp. NBC_00659]|uniref:hypothetical protein n=1 Tax=Streptomyces sp. NBC_00659 TaxID=2903669 RepID=UPI002E33B513|nr:hypothetical protein [Streptomyces sp. NBC_00659]
MDKRVEAGWFQRLAWSVLAVGSFGLLVWVPFLYVAIRRGRGSDWGAFASFVLYEVGFLSLVSLPKGEGEATLGLVVLGTLVLAVWLLAGPLFDKPTPRNAMTGAGHAPWPGQAAGNPYLR